jgi:hypothetical protein
MSIEKKEAYVSPEVVKHELLRDITATKSGNNHTNYSNYSNHHHRGGLFGWFARFGGW